MVKNPLANAGDARDSGSIPGMGSFPRVGNGNPLQDSCLENFKRSLEGYSPWGCNESGTTEHVHTHIHTHTHTQNLCSRPSLTCCWEGRHTVSFHTRFLEHWLGKQGTQLQWWMGLVGGGALSL